MNMKPTYENLIGSDGSPSRVSYAMGVHPNPRWWKYRWRVFHLGTPQGRAFFYTQRLSTHKAMKLIRELEAKDEGYVLYNYCQPRIGNDTPFNLSHPRWKDYTLALPYDEDHDLEWEGHK